MSVNAKYYFIQKCIKPYESSSLFHCVLKGQYRDDQQGMESEC